METVTFCPKVFCIDHLDVGNEYFNDIKQAVKKLDYKNHIIIDKNKFSKQALKFKSINISKKSSSLKIIHPSDNDFYEACREKLGWSLDITAKKNH